MDRTSLKACGGIVTPAAALREEQRRTQYGTLADLPDEELADPEELERVVYKEIWWPILRLPQQRWECPIRPNMDEDGRVDWGAFGTVDFDSYRPPFSKLRYKAQQLKERLKDMVITCEMIGDRIPGRAKYQVLKLVRTGVLDTDDIAHEDMRRLALKYLEVLRLRQEIQELQERSRAKEEEKAAKLWASLGC